MKTRWKDILGLGGKYQISSDGQVRIKTRSGYLEKVPVLHHSGYLGVVIRGKYFSVHRLVAQLFIDIRLGNNRVGHKNGDKLDNRVENLTIFKREPPAGKQLPLLSPILRFLDNIDTSGDCWLWTGPLNGVGYGSLGIKGKSVMAHRYSWEIHNGQIPDGLVVMHKCDVRNCVNPDHLMLGTYSDNIQDAIKKGRFKSGPQKKRVVGLT